MSVMMTYPVTISLYLIALIVSIFGSRFRNLGPRILFGGVFLNVFFMGAAYYEGLTTRSILTALLSLVWVQVVLNGRAKEGENEL